MKPEHPLKVLQVVGSLGMGGAETWLMEALRLWSRNGDVQMDFLITSGNPGIFDEEALHLGAKIHYVRYGRNNLTGFARQFCSVLRAGNYHALHDHSDYVGGWHALIGLGVLPEVRVIHVHNPWLHISANYAVTPVRRLMTMAGRQLVFRLATDVCGTSAEILRRYGFEPGTYGRLSVRVLHCGIDVAKFNTAPEKDRESVRQEFGFPQNAKIVLFAGRLDRAMEFDHPQNHKNSWFALHVARAALEKDAAVRLLMAGDGAESRGRLERYIGEWGLRDQLRLVGIRRDMPRLMRAADILLFPSRQEGLGMVAVEAQAAGLPVLASTAVPRECVIVPELYDAMPLGESVGLWAGALLQRIAKPRPAMDFCRREIEASAFSIANSARQLKAIYGRMAS